MKESLQPVEVQEMETMEKNYHQWANLKTWTIHSPKECKKQPDKKYKGRMDHLQDHEATDKKEIHGGRGNPLSPWYTLT